jgi:signal transduction histidine kinase
VERERRFTADASHELRTPLAAIETAIDVTLTQNRSRGEYQRVLQAMLTQTQRLRRLSQQLLVLSRMDAQAVRTSFVLFDLGEAVGAVVDAFRDTYPAAQVSLTIANDGIQVYGDIELLARALTNILENAVKHVGQDVAVTITVATTPGRSARVTVADNGPGIDRDLADAVFQRFRRGSASRSGDGTGLGLAIVEAVLNVHGGSARLLSRPPGEGAAFELTLPVAEPMSR